MLTVALTVPAPTEAETLATSGIFSDNVGNRVHAFHHRLERNILGGIRYADDDAGVLLRQQAFRARDVEQNRRDQRDDRDDKDEALMRQHPAQSAFVPIPEARPVFFRPAIKFALVFLFFFAFRSQQFRAHHRRERQRNERRHADRHAQGDGKLAEQAGRRFRS